MFKRPIRQQERGFSQEQPFTWLQQLDPDEEDVDLAESLVNEAEYSGKKLSTNVRVPGRLCKESRFGDFYEDVLKADAETVSIIRHGYIFPFLQTPPLAQDTRNNKSCRNMQEFAWTELLRLEKLKCIRRVPGLSRVEVPLSVVFSNKWRLLVDTSRHINPYVEKRKACLDSLDDVADLVKEGSYIAVDDLDSGYWHVPLHPSMYEFFGCHIENPVTGETVYFQWMVLFLGLSDAVYIFTKVLRPVVNYLRSIGWKGIIYIDDSGTIADSYLETLLEIDGERYPW